MKLVASALLFAFAFAGGNDQWSLPSTLPSQYTGLPFNLALATGPNKLKFEAHNLPPFVSLDANKGQLSGTSTKKGAFPFSIDVSDNSGKK